MIETSITLSSLNCSGCVRNVTKALQTIPEIEILQTDIPTKTVYLRYSVDHVSLEQIKAVLAGAGYSMVTEQARAEKQPEHAVIGG